MNDSLWDTKQPFVLAFEMKFILVKKKINLKMVLFLKSPLFCERSPNLNVSRMQKKLSRAFWDHIDWKKHKECLSNMYKNRDYLSR